MKRNLKKLASVLLVLCMTLTLFTGFASAAGVSSSVRSTLLGDTEYAGFAEEYVDDFHFVDAGRAGDAVTVKLPHDLGADDRPVAVAVTAVDASGNSVGRDTRIVLGTYSSGAVTVTYQENGCRYFAMMPTQGVIDHGSIHYLETSATKKSNDVYDVYVEARLSMSDDLANFVVFNKTDNRLLDMRFTCYLENDVINASHNAELQNFVFDDPYGLYELLEPDTYATDGGIVISYKLDVDAFEDWKYDSASELKAKLQAEMSISCTATATKAELLAGANYDNEVWSYGHLDITYEPGGRMQRIPGVGVEMFHLPAKMDYIVVDDDTHKPSGGGSRPVIDKDELDLAPIPGWLNGDDHIAYIIGRDNGLVEPMATITRAEVATIFFRLLKDNVRDSYMTQDNDFSDVNEGDWYNCAVSTMAALGVVTGRPDGTFRPNDAITRAEFAAIAARFDGRDATTRTNFSDIDGHWAADEIARAYQNGWVNGYNGKFRPNDAITRAEAMTLVNRVLHRVPETPADLLSGMQTWRDNMNESAWYYLAVQEATNSHEYKRKTNNYEDWTELDRIPDWTALEQ